MQSTHSTHRLMPLPQEIRRVSGRASERMSEAESARKASSAGEANEWAMRADGQNSKQMSKWLITMQFWGARNHCYAATIKWLFCSERTKQGKIHHRSLSRDVHPTSLAPKDGARSFEYKQISKHGSIESWVCFMSLINWIFELWANVHKVVVVTVLSLLI